MPFRNYFRTISTLFEHYFIPEKNLDRRNRHPINDADPRDILNQIKKFQPNFGDVPQYGGDHVRIGMGSMTGNSMGMMGNMGNMGYGNVPVTTSYGLPLQYPQAMQAANPMQGSGNSDDPLRNSFARLVISDFIF